MADEVWKFLGARVVRATEKAILVEVSELEGEEFWVPQSVVHDDSEVWKVGDEGTLVVEYWWARKKGFCEGAVEVKREGR